MNWNDKVLFVRNMVVLEKYGVFMFNVDKKFIMEGKYKIILYIIINWNVFL